MTGAAVDKRGEGVGRTVALGRFRRGSLSPWLLLGPSLVLLIATRLYPITNVLVQSVLTAGPGKRTFTTGNFSYLLALPDFARSIIVTVTLVVVSVACQTVLAFLIALLLQKQTAGNMVIRTIILLPLAVPVAAAASVWGIIFRPDGPLNGILAALGASAQPFLTSADQALYCIAFILTWSATGYWANVFCAGLNEIPAPLYEAATIDGADKVQEVRYVSLPMLRRQILFVTVSGTVANFLAFAPTQILTRGGPTGSTNVLMFEIFTQAFTNYDLGLAAAETVVVILILSLFVAAQFKLLGNQP